MYLRLEALGPLLVVLRRLDVARLADQRLLVMLALQKRMSAICFQLFRGSDALYRSWLCSIWAVS